MQVLIDSSAEFLSFSLKYIRKNYDAIVDSKLGYHLVIACISRVKTHESLTFIFEDFIRKAYPAPVKKNQKRIIISYLGCCPIGQIDAIANSLRASEDFLNHVSTKAGSVMLMVLIKRDHRPTLETFISHLRDQPRSVLKSHYFRKMVGILQNSCHSGVHLTIFQTLISMTTFNLYLMKRFRSLHLLHLPYD